MPIRGREDKRERDAQRLKNLAFVDDLTALYNRRYLYQYLSTELKETREAGKQLALFMMDVDRFKEINDTYGHLYGDNVLKEIADILSQSFRGGDTIIRYAGDEFMAILPGAAEDTAINTAKRIMQKIDQNIFGQNKGKQGIHVTMSFGLALFPRDAQDPEKLIYQADRALYSSKHKGRNCVSTTRDIAPEILNQTWLQQLFPCAQLIGRDPELNRLKELLLAAEKNKSQFAIIKGERGIGKTRLMNEFKKYAWAQGVAEASATCSPEISSQPYQILILALERLFAALGSKAREFVRSLPEAQIAQLANYIPTLKQFLPEQAVKAQAKLSPDQALLDLFKGICQSFIYMVKRNTLLLVIDDFQWIDKETLQFFNYIIKDLHNIPMLIMCAYREDELNRRSDSANLQALLLKTRKSKLVDELALSALAKAETEELVRTIFADIQATDKFTDVVYEVSAGNPLFIEEVLRSLLNKGFIYYQDGRWCSKEITPSTVPHFLKDAIQKRVNLLDEESKPVVKAAAVIGEVFEFDVLTQLLESDPGYVLEAIDRATKQDLIKPESPFQTDKFKFNSGAVRDVIYGNISLKDRQQLHKKLASIEEKSNKHNIDSVVGSLGYHFAKAQDMKKAAFYSDLLLDKAKHMPADEQAFDFLQQALLEKVEQIVIPLSNSSMKLVSAMVRTLRLAIQNVRLYPRDSSIRKEFVNQALKYLKQILAQDEKIVLATAENRLLVNGEEISVKATHEAGADAFIRILVEYRIKGITFTKALSEEELIIFLEALKQNYDQLMEQDGLSALLRKNGVQTIKISEVRYEQTTKLAKQRTRFEEAMLVDYLLGKVSNLEGDKTEIAAQLVSNPRKLAQTLQASAQKAVGGQGKPNIQAQANNIAQSLTRLADQVLSQAKGPEEQYNKKIAEVLMALDAPLRWQVLQTQTPISASGKDVIQGAIKELSDQQILEIAGSEFSRNKTDLVGLRRLMQRVLADPQRRPKLLPQLKDKLEKLGLNQEELKFALEGEDWQKLPLEEKVQRILKLSAPSYLKLGISRQIEQIVAQLIERAKFEQIDELINKLIQQLSNQSPQLRRVSIEDLGKVSAVIIAKEKYLLLEPLLSALVSRLDQERDPKVYALIVQVLADSCIRLIKKQNFAQASGILREFNLRLAPTSRLLEIQKKTIRATKEKIIGANSLVKSLAQELVAKIETHQDFWQLSKLVSELGAAAIEPLYALGLSRDPYADPFKIYALRWSVAKVLKGMGEEATIYIKQKLADQRPEQIRMALQLLGHMQNQQAVKYLQPLLKADDLQLRKDAISSLGKIGGKEAIKLLSESIKDEHNEIRLAAIRALANIGTPEVIALLKPLTQDEQLKSEAQKTIQRIKRK